MPGVGAQPTRLRRGRQPGYVMQADHRAAIQTKQIINRLQAHVLENKRLSRTQLRAAEVLLRKVLPDLAHVMLDNAGGGGLVVEIQRFGAAARAEAEGPPVIEAEAVEVEEDEQLGEAAD